MAQVVVVKNAFDIFDEVNVDDIEDFVEKETKKNSKLVEEENKPIVYNKSKLDDQFNNNHKNKSRNRRKNKNSNSAYGSSHNSVDSDPNQGRAQKDQGYRSNNSGPKQFTNVNNGGSKFFKDFSSRDPSYVSDVIENRGGHDDGRVNRGGHSDRSRDYHGGGNGGGRGYHGGYNGDERGYHGGGNGGGRGYHGGGNGDGRGFRGGGNGDGRGFRGGGYGGGRGNHGGNGGGGMTEHQRVDRNGEVNKTVYASNQPVNGGSAKDNSSTDSQPPLSEAELERREKLRQEMERDAQLMTLAQYEKVLQDKKKELQEKLSNVGDNKVEKSQPETNVKQAGFTLQKNSYQRDNKNTSQKKILHEVRNMVYLSLQPTRYRPRRWEQNEQGSSVISDKDKNSDDHQTEDAEGCVEVKVPDMNEFPVLCSNASKRV